MASTLNIRIDSALKERGDKVLKENGISVTEAIRALWETLARKRTSCQSFFRTKIPRRKPRERSSMPSSCWGLCRLPDSRT